MNLASECVINIIKSVGKIVGIKLATRLIRDPLESTKTMYKEVREVKVTDVSVEIIIDHKVPPERFKEIMKTFLSGIDEQYSKIIGRVSRTLIRKSLELLTVKYRRTFPWLSELLKEYGK